MNASSVIGIANDQFFAEGDKGAHEVIFGSKCVEQLVTRVPSFSKRALLVTDSGLTAAGHPKRVMKLLESAGVEVTLFDQSIENPRTRVCRLALKLQSMRRLNCLSALVAEAPWIRPRDAISFSPMGAVWRITGVLVRRSIRCCHWLPFPQLQEREVNANLSR